MQDDQMKTCRNISTEHKNSPNNQQTTENNFLYTYISDFTFGIIDSLQILNVFDIILKSEKIRVNLGYCIFLNGIIYISSVIFYWKIFEPLMHSLIELSSFGYFLSIGKYFYYLFWLFPVFLACNILTSFWIDEIYYDALEIVENTKSINVEGGGLISAISNQIQRLLIVLSFIISINLLNLFNFVPLSGGIRILKFFTMSILNAFYVFEYILLQKYINNYKAILYFIEYKFFYFLGYGILLTLLINYIDSVTINSAIFLILFPMFLLASVKVNNKRFSEYKEIKIKNLRIFFVIKIIYEKLLKVIFKIFRLEGKKN